jgi:tetratricopeptide (TPR) repeat protein
MILAAIVVVAGLRLLPRATLPPETPEALSVLIADFDNQTGDDVFTGVLEQATRIGLEGASFVNAYRRGDARKVAEIIQPGDAALDEEMARLVAQREGINVVVTGSISEEDGSYAISVRAIDGASGESIASHRIESEDREGVLAVIGKLAGRTRESLGDTTPESVRMAAKETFTAASLEAAHAYAQAQELVAGGKFEEAFEAYSEAVKLDPDFGRAYAGMAVATVNMGQAEKAVEYFELAMQHIDRMTEREKYRTRSTYYFTLRNYERAAEVLQELIDAFPYDQAGLINLPHFYYQARQMGRALEAARYAVEIYPGSTIANANAALLSVYAGDFENATAQCESLLESFGNFEPLHICMGLSQLALGNRDAAIARYEHLAGVSTWGSSLAAAGLADIALYEGRLDDAEAILNEAVEVALANEDSAGAARDLATLGHMELLRENPQRAAGYARRAIETDQRGRILFEAARVLIVAREEAEAGGIITQLADRLAPEPQTYAILLEGELLLAQGDSRRAVDRFLDAQQNLDTWLGRVDLGRAYLENGAYPEAHAEFENALKRRGEAAIVFLDEDPTYHYLPPVYYWLGQAQEGLGSPAAAESYRKFLEIKKNGDADPMVAESRRHLSEH